MTIYTIGFTQKKAEKFFEAIKANEIQLLIDIRLNNRSQLAGFTKDGDIQYFLDKICGTKYIHCEEYAPPKELLTKYQKKEITWDGYETIFAEIMDRRGGCKTFLSRFSDFERVCLLCSEASPEHCHRRLIAEAVRYESEKPVEIVHL